MSQISQECSMRMRSIIFALALGLTSSAAQADAKFEAFIQTLWPQMNAAGVSRDLFDAAFEGITEPDQLVLKQSATQPEFNSTTSEYLAKAVTPARISTGQKALSENGKLLGALQQKYGVDKGVILGIWGVESNYGADLGSMKVMRSLATLLYAKRKVQFAREQMVAAFKILQRGIRSPANFTGSWAAAMGHTQFIPTSYLSSAVDWNGDGKKDIWGSKQDALASTANYLAKAGWKGDRPWGWPITLPKGFDKSQIGRKHWKTVAEWQQLGIRGNGLNAPQAKAFVMIPQGPEGPAFLVTQNFMAIMAYNLSHSYALAVAHLGDRIEGGEEFTGTWPDTGFGLSFEQRVEIQKRLTAAGFDTGGSDGRFGARTYEAVLGYQKKVGMALDAKPSVKLLERLRAGG
jgi:membrane-bound lytic murein transglycosylase B